MKVTAIIPTLNEEENIERAISSLDFADELIVIDSFSTDNTVSILKKYPEIRILQRKFDDFSSQKNYAIGKASYDWIFLLDADEEVTYELKKELLGIISSDDVNCSGFYMYRNFFIEKERLFFSGYQRSKVIRFFNRKKSSYAGKVHEKIVSTGTILPLNAKINHYSYNSYKQYKSKLKFYAKLQALELYEIHKKTTIYHSYLKPVFRFLTHYLFKLGFLDLKKGFVISYLQGYGVYMRYKELKKLYKKN